jgi:rhodanese-related sulfurtransferase
MPGRNRRSSSHSRGGIGSFLRRPIVQILMLVIVAIVIYLIAISGGETTGIPREINAEQAYQKYQAGAFLLDVRTQKEWNEYHAPNTTLIPLDQLQARMSEIPRDKEIVVICRSGSRSQEGRDLLLSGGFTQVTSMAGGLKEWSALGYPIEGTRP